MLWAPQSFHFPLFMTMLHLAVIFLFSALSRALVQCSSHRARVVLSWPDYLRRVAPTGVSVGGAGGWWGVTLEAEGQEQKEAFERLEARPCFPASPRASSLLAACPPCPTAASDMLPRAPPGEAPVRPWPCRSLALEHAH